MNTANRFARRLFALSMLSVSLATTALANEAGPHLVGPRSTIPRQQRVERPANQTDGELQASRHETAACQAVRVAHYGHPGKGLDRIQRIDVPCAKMRLSTR